MQPKLPTYRSVAGVLEHEKGSGAALVGWTALRTLLIAPPLIVVGVDTKKAFVGAALASILISSLTFLRIFDARHSTPLKGRKSIASRRKMLAARARG